MSVAGSCLGEMRRPDLSQGQNTGPSILPSGDTRLVVSPAVIEMGGVLVTPRERDFERLDASRRGGHLSRSVPPRVNGRQRR